MNDFLARIAQSTIAANQLTGLQQPKPMANTPELAIMANEQVFAKEEDMNSSPAISQQKFLQQNSLPENALQSEPIQQEMTFTTSEKKIADRFIQSKSNQNLIKPGKQQPEELLQFALPLEEKLPVFKSNDRTTEYLSSHQALKTEKNLVGEIPDNKPVAQSMRQQLSPKDENGKKQAHFFNQSSNNKYNQQKPELFALEKQKQAHTAKPMQSFLLKEETLKPSIANSVHNVNTTDDVTITKTDDKPLQIPDPPKQLSLLKAETLKPSTAKLARNINTSGDVAITQTDNKPLQIPNPLKQLSLLKEETLKPSIAKSVHNVNTTGAAMLGADNKPLPAPNPVTQAPQLRINIGRLEIRAAKPATTNRAQIRTSQRAKPTLLLRDYLKQSAGDTL